MSAGFTPLQGRYLAFIHAYTIVNGRPPAEADLQRHFRVSPSSVHDMILRMEERGLIARTPRAARSLRVYARRVHGIRSSAATWVVED